jgi:ferredoxin
MPLHTQTDPRQIERLLKLIFSQPRPPVARCRLLSSGFGPAYMFDTTDDLVGCKACLGCGCCMDACPLLARDAKRRQRCDARSSMALETLVGEDCDRCGNCVLACPQVDPTIKHYLVQTHLAEGMATLLSRAVSDETYVLNLILASDLLQGRG